MKGNRVHTLYIVISINPPPPPPPISPAGAAGQEKNWTQLRKQVFDNMSSYLARKEERLRGKAVDECSGDHEPELPTEPPDKKIKVDDH